MRRYLHPQIHKSLYIYTDGSFSFISASDLFNVQLDNIMLKKDFFTQDCFRSRYIKYFFSN